MEKRVNGEAGALEMPTGYIPRYEDLALLFREVLDKGYTRGEYEQQFKLRIPENLAKIERIRNIYHTKVFDTPHALLQALDEQQKSLKDWREKYGDYVSPGVCKQV